MHKNYAVIIGAGPAGLTAALELLRNSELTPLIFEESDQIGGISRTVNYKGNRIDIGGHRFFSKSDQVMDWWQDILPMMGAPAKDDRLLGRKVTLADSPGAPDPEETDRVMLVRQRLSRIFFTRRFFEYPISLSLQTLLNLGGSRVARIMASYLLIRLAPIKKEKSLEDFFINRFGSELYRTFFRDYTEKVWGVPCREIRPEWGAQRIKGLSVTQAVVHAVKRVLKGPKGIRQKDVETSLIEQFLYPKLGPGQLWEEVASQVQGKGGQLRLNCRVTALHSEGERVTGVTVTDRLTGKSERVDGTVVFSSMPVRELAAAFHPPVPEPVRRVADDLCYRDFITVGLLCSDICVAGGKKGAGLQGRLPDNWIYIQENDVRIGRLQVFNNWSPYLVADPEKIWLGLEYFCSEGDDLWRLDDQSIGDLAVRELEKLGFIAPGMVLDRVVIRVPKAYPAYFGSYGEFPVLREHFDSFSNLFLMGRNGMHRYNNMDHSMLTAMTAVDLFINGVRDKERVWSVNAESEYHEKK